VHLHPRCSIINRSDQAITVAFLGGTFQIVAADSGSLSLETGWYCSEFGRRHPGNTVCVSGRGSNIELGYRVICLANNAMGQLEKAHTTLGMLRLPEVAHTLR